MKEAPGTTPALGIHTIMVHENMEPVGCELFGVNYPYRITIVPGKHRQVGPWSITEIRVSTEAYDAGLDKLWSDLMAGD